MNLRNLSLLFFVLFSLFGCALPSSQRLPEQYVSSYEREVELLVQEGLVESQRGRYVDAEIAFRKALYALPQSERIKMNLAVVLERQGNFEDAHVIYRELLARNSKNVRYRSGMARLYASQLDYKKAFLEYQKIEQLLDDNRAGSLTPGKYAAATAAMYRNRAAIEFRLGYEEKATCSSESALLANPGAMPEKLRHIRLLLSRGLVEKADETLGYVLPDVGPTPLLHQLALVSYEMKRDEKTVLLCEELLKREEVPPSVEGDCLWIVALIDQYTISNGDPEDFSDEERVVGYELPYREFSTDTERLFLPVRLSAQILTVQEQLLAEREVSEEVDDSSITGLALFAIPKADQMKLSALASTQ